MRKYGGLGEKVTLHFCGAGPKLPELYRKKVEYLGEALSDPTIRDEAFSILRDLIQGVVVTPGPKRSFSVELIGEITKMIALPDDKAMIDEISVKVVAGARNQRCLHLDEVWL